MEVILLETFDRLGQIGDVVKVKNGFARNFLIPNKKALRANKENKEKFLKIKNDLILKNKETINISKEVIKKIEKKEIIFIRNASDNGQLYGSVSPKDISNYFHENKIDIKPSNINLHSSIKKIGIYDINIKLHAEVSCILKINVATSKENAKDQKIEFDKAENNNKEPGNDEKIPSKKVEQKTKEELINNDAVKEKLSDVKELELDTVKSVTSETKKLKVKQESSNNS